MAFRVDPAVAGRAPDQKVVVVLAADYYPFGLAFVGNQHFDLDESIVKQLFGNKEFQDVLNLTWYDFGARMYDPAIGRWIGVDPHAEKYPHITPYGFVLNNPARYIDSDGRDPQEVDSSGVFATCWTPWTSDCDFAPLEAVSAAWGAVRKAATDAVLSDDFEKNYQEMTTNPKYGRVKPNAILDITDQIVQDTPMVASSLWLLLIGSVRGTGGPPLRASQLISGPRGSVARGVLERAAKSTGPVENVVTRLTKPPAVGRGLSVSVGEGAETLSNAARAGGQLYRASIPKALIVELERIGLVKESITTMGDVVAKELRFSPGASEFIVHLFK